MEEIKLILILILTVWTYAKLRHARSIAKRQSVTEKEVLVSEAEILPEEREFIDRVEREERGRLDSLLFSPTVTKHPINTVNQQMGVGRLPRPMDANDILGGEYSRCKTGTTLDMSDPVLVYTSGYFNRNPFRPPHNSTYFLKNQQYLPQMRALLSQPFTLEDDCRRMNGGFGHAEMSEESGQINVKQHRMLDNSTRKNQDSDSIDLHQNKSTRILRLKRKLIAKRKRMCTPQKKSIFAGQPSTSESTKDKKNGTAPKILISLQDEIRKREEQIQILKRLHADRVSQK